MLQGLVEIIKLWCEEEYRKSEKEKEALEAIRNALQATKIYAAQIREGRLRDREREFELSDLWSKAAVRARHLSSDLSHRLGEKGDYWLEPESWTADAIFNTGISIEQIDAELSKLLGYIS